jgi:hypothetical protein
MLLLLLSLPPQSMQAHLLMPYPSKNSSMGGAPSSSGGTDQPDGYGAAGAAAGPGGAAAAPAAAQAPIRSIYALATNAAGTAVAVGTTDTHIRLLDPRTGDKVAKLKVGFKGQLGCAGFSKCPAVQDGVSGSVGISNGHTFQGQAPELLRDLQRVQGMILICSGVVTGVDCGLECCS